MSQDKQTRAQQDPELKAMRHIMNQLDGLSDDARGRVLSYITDRFAPIPFRMVTMPPAEDDDAVELESDEGYANRMTGAGRAAT